MKILSIGGDWDVVNQMIREQYFPIRNALQPGDATYGSMYVVEECLRYVDYPANVITISGTYRMCLPTTCRPGVRSLHESKDGEVNWWSELAWERRENAGGEDRSAS